MAAGCAGHVLDYDDTLAAGIVHASAPVAPVALLLAAERGLSLAAALEAYAAGFEATAALARASHPALYERGWHPTSVCGVAGAAVAAARLLGLEPERERIAVGIALLGASGLQAAFGTDAKALQVGHAAATGLEAAQLSAAGASVSPDAIATGFESAYGGRWETPQGPPAIRDNWIKAYPCCLLTHAAIDAAQALRAENGVPGGRDRGHGASERRTARRPTTTLQMGSRQSSRSRTPPLTPCCTARRASRALRPRMQPCGPSRQSGYGCGSTRPCSRPRRGSRPAGRS